jgi:hypothetical protein
MLVCIAWRAGKKTHKRNLFKAARHGINNQPHSIALFMLLKSNITNNKI